MKVFVEQEQALGEHVRHFRFVVLCCVMKEHVTEHKPAHVHVQVLKAFLFHMIDQQQISVDIATKQTTIC